MTQKTQSGGVRGRVHKNSAPLITRARQLSSVKLL
jgi:hypothetical protein